MFLSKFSRFSKITTELKFLKTAPVVFPTFQILNPEGKLFGDRVMPMPQAEAMKIFDLMISVSAYDSILYDVQRQGRISFYMANSGEEGLQVASAAALSFHDMIWPQYRELGVFLYRGFTVQMITDQCMSTKDEVGKGRQMPVHYCFPEANIQAVTSPIATQLPHAAGAGFAFKMEKSDKVSVAFFGEGASSEGDFAVALNFAAVKKSQTIFICRNNGFAISTPTSDQFASDGVAPRGTAYGIPSVRVDGNDVFAVYEAVTAARELCLKEGPVLIELMTYRMSHHSTSDDSTRYRAAAEIDRNEKMCPIKRLGKYLVSEKLITEEREEAVRKQSRHDVMTALKVSEKKKRAAIKEMFTDVYAEMPWHLKEQLEGLENHIAAHSPDTYNLEAYDKSSPCLL